MTLNPRDENVLRFGGASYQNQDRGDESDAPYLARAAVLGHSPDYVLNDAQVGLNGRGLLVEASAPGHRLVTQ